MRRSFFVSSLVVAALAAVVLPEIVAAQDLHPSRRPSPMGMARTLVDDAYVRVVYSRPYLRGRDNVFGTAESDALVPYGQIWRTGANEATEITTTKDLEIGDAVLPAGTYSLFTTPGAESWKIHFNSRLGLNGTAWRNPATGEFERDGYLPENDVLIATVPVGKVDEEVDQFTISFDEEMETGSALVLTWQNTQVKMPFTVME